MAMVQPKSQKLRLFTTHLLLLVFIAAIMFPLLMVIAISLREGNFATGSLIPESISCRIGPMMLTRASRINPSSSRMIGFIGALLRCRRASDQTEVSTRTSGTTALFLIAIGGIVFNLAEKF